MEQMVFAEQIWMLMKVVDAWLKTKEAQISTEAFLSGTWVGSAPRDIPSVNTWTKHFSQNH